METSSSACKYYAPEETFIFQYAIERGEGTVQKGEVPSEHASVLTDQKVLMGREKSFSFSPLKSLRIWMKNRTEACR